jgi:hypothetical protein
MIVAIIADPKMIISIKANNGDFKPKKIIDHKELRTN